MEDIARVGIGARVPEQTKRNLEVEASVLGFEGLSALLNYLILNRTFSTSTGLIMTLTKCISVCQKVNFRSYTR
jgi:hypothetical protein